MTANVNAVNPPTTPKPGLLPEMVGLIEEVVLVDAVAVTVEAEIGEDPDAVDVGLRIGLDAIDVGLGAGVGKADGVDIDVGCGKTVTV